MGHLDIFSKDSLAERKRQSTEGDDGWLPGYLQQVYVPTKDDFLRLQRCLDRRRTIYLLTYCPLRNKRFAHREVAAAEHIRALFRETNIREVERMLTFLLGLHYALQELLNNGTRPLVRSGPYSVRAMRMRLSGHPGGHVSSIQEMAVQQTDRFLASLIQQP
jgi:hypothetical protein